MYTDQRDIPVGATVYDVTGEKVGSVLEYNGASAYLMVEKGWLFTKDFYVPLDLIERVDADGVYLAVSKADLNDSRYENPPAVSGAAPTLAGSVATTAGTDVADISIPVREEELVVGTQQTEAGRVHIHKDVVTEQQTVTVPVQKEQITIERVPTSGELTTTEDAFVERDIDIPVMGETAVVGKRVVGVEEVRVHKDVVTEQEQVSDVVRKEQVTIDPSNPQVATSRTSATLDEETGATTTP
jgi:uncharacterized protein (TIGR02271 family)